MLSSCKTRQKPKFDFNFTFAAFDKFYIIRNIDKITKMIITKNK